MNNLRKIIKVFIASPGDLGNERRIAREVAEEYNSNNSDVTGYQIEMVGWEETIGGVGRPQEIINKDLARCELFVGVLWKRWGTAPDNSGKYSSGFEEEFSISFERHQKEKTPQMLMLFKDVDKSLLQDPGDGLRKVLDFKENLIKEKKVLYEVFEIEREFEKKLRRWITSYVNTLLEKEREGLISEGTESSAVNVVEVPQSATSENKIDVHNFLKTLSDSIGGEAWSEFSAADVAYFKLLGFSLNKGGNDNNFLEAHDANLIYLNESNYKFDFNAELSLIKAGLNGYGNQNIPIWRWLSLEPHRLKFLSYILVDKLKSKFIDAIAFLSINCRLIDAEMVSEWFNKSESDDVRLSAIKYLSKMGNIDDVDLLISEYETKNSRTLNASLEAIVLINLRESLSKGFEKILELQPTQLSKKIIKLLNESGKNLDTSMLIKGIESSNEDVRLSCIDNLILKGGLNDELAESLIEHEDIKVRLKALIFISSKYKTFYDVRAKDILKLPADAVDKDKYYNEYLSNALQYESNDGLTKRLKFEFLTDAKVLIAFAIKDKKNNIDLVRQCLNNGCVTLHEDNVKSFLPAGYSHSQFITGEVRSMILNNMLSDCVNWLASCMIKEDIGLIRRVISTGLVTIFSPTFEYFKRYGEWDDIFLLSNCRFHSPRSLLGSFLDGEHIYDELSDLFLKIAKGREVDLIFSPLSDSFKYRVIEKVSARVFLDINDSKIIELLNEGSPLVREKTSLRVVELFGKGRIKSILDSVTGGVTYFYNVVHWLDLGVSVKQSLCQNAVKKFLRDY